MSMHLKEKSPDSDSQGGCESIDVFHIQKHVFPMKSRVLLFIAMKGSSGRTLNLVLLLQINKYQPLESWLPQESPWWLILAISLTQASDTSDNGTELQSHAEGSSGPLLANPTF